MGGVFGAYLLALGIVGTRWWKGAGVPAPPASLIGATAVYGVCGLVAGASPRLGASLAWGLTIGAYLAGSDQAPPVVARIAGVPPAASTTSSPASSSSSSGSSSSLLNAAAGAALGPAEAAAGALGSLLP